MLGCAEGELQTACGPSSQCHHNEEANDYCELDHTKLGRSTYEGIREHTENCDYLEHLNNPDGRAQWKKNEGGCKEDAHPPE